jgi:hypothetical protein
LARGPRLSVIPGYVVPGSLDRELATVLAVILGSLLVLGTVLVVIRGRRLKGMADE